MAEEFEASLRIGSDPIMDIIDQIKKLIAKNSLAGIKHIFEDLHPCTCTQILNCSVDMFIPLASAIKHNRLRISRYFLELSLYQGRYEMCERWKSVHHPLNVAMDAKNMNLIGLVSQNLFDIDDYTSGPYTPLMYAIFSDNIDYVKLMVHLGANVNRTCFNGRSPLMASTKNSDICHFLVTLDVDLNHKDNDGNTALHQAVMSTNIECILILINAGANFRIRNKDWLTPLMLASVKMKYLIAMNLCEYAAYSELDKIEALEVLFASYACAGQSGISYSIQALHMRKDKYNKYTPFPSQEVLDYSGEFLNEAELEQLVDKPLRLAFQGILIIERLFGRNNSVYLQFILRTALIAKKMKKMHKFQQLINYIKEYDEPSKTSLIAACTQDFKILFEDFLEDRNPENIFENGAFALFKILSSAMEKMWLELMDQLYTTPFIEECPYAELVDTFLYMASVISSMTLPLKYDEQFRNVILKQIKYDPRFIVQESLLHRAIKVKNVLPEARVALIQVLLENGANVNSKDFLKRTPLMYALIYASDDILLNIVELLKYYKCHLDCRDVEGFSAIEFKRWRKILNCSNDFLKLHCKAARTILKYKIRYERMLSRRLAAFIRIHN